MVIIFIFVICSLYMIQPSYSWVWRTLLSLVISFYIVGMLRSMVQHLRENNNEDLEVRRYSVIFRYCMYNFYYREPGRLWTDFHNFHKYLHNDSILGFIWGLVSTMQEHRILLDSTLADCYILKYFILNLVQSHHGLRGDFGHTNIYMVIQSNTASRIQNYIVCDLLWTWYKCLTQKDPFIIKPVDGRFDCSSPILESLTTSKLTDFSVFQRNTWKTYKTTYYTTKL